MAESNSDRGPKFTDPTPKHPKPVEHPQSKTLYPQLREKADGEIVMSYAVFCSMKRDNIEDMLRGQEKALQRGRGMRKIKT